ncbi:MAG: hypothetical protein ACREUA_08590 [Burkholderiales bacterium]
MDSRDDRDKATGPGGLTLRQIHEMTKQSYKRDLQQRGKVLNKLAGKQSRWQRFVAYVWDKKRR